jgi:hypothetical protein
MGTVSRLNIGATPANLRPIPSGQGVSLFVQASVGSADRKRESIKNAFTFFMPGAGGFHFAARHRAGSGNNHCALADARGKNDAGIK